MAGWEALRAINIEADQYRQAERDREAQPVECPNDAEPLTVGTDGRPFCKFDGWRPA
jgi:hypothetical protein